MARGSRPRRRCSWRHLTSLGPSRGRGDARAGRHAAAEKNSRHLLLDAMKPAPWTEAALFAAVGGPSWPRRVIRPALEARQTTLSATASSTPRSPIRGSARGLGIDRVLELNVGRRRPHARPHVRPAARCGGRGGPRLLVAGPHGQREDDGTFRAAVADGYHSVGRALPGAHRRPWMARSRCGTSPHASGRRSVFDRRSSSSTRPRACSSRPCKDGPVHAYLFHGPPGVGKQKTALAFAAHLCSATCGRVESAGASRSLSARAVSATRIPIHEVRSAAARPPHASVRGRVRVSTCSSHRATR